MKVMKVMKVWRSFWRRKRGAVKKIAISVLVILSLAAAMGDRPKMPPAKAEELDADYVYLIGAGKPVFRIYSPRRKQTERLIAPTIEIIN